MFAISFSVPLFINALLFSFQLFKIINEKSLKGLTLLSFIGVSLLQVSIIFYSLLSPDYALLSSYLWSLLVCGSVMALTLIYNQVKQAIDREKLAFITQAKQAAIDQLGILENIIALMPGHVYWMNREHVYLGCNDNQAKTVNLSSRHEIVGKTYQDLLDKKTAEACKKVDDSVMLNGLPVVLEEPFYDANRTEKTYLSSKVPLCDTSGNIIGMVGISLDITDRKQVEKLQLEKAAADCLLENIIALMPGHVYWMNREHVYLGCNDNQAKTVNLSREEFIGKTYADFKGFDKYQQIDAQVMDSGIPQLLEETLYLANGTERIFLSHKVPLRDTAGNISGMVGISFDITASKQAIAERLAILENIIALMPGHVYWMNREHIYLGCNDNIVKAFNLNSREEFIGKTYADFKNFDKYQQVDEEVMHSGRPQSLEETVYLVDRTERIFLSNKVPLVDKTNNIIGMVGISLDITDRKQVEKLQLAKAAADCLLENIIALMPGHVYWMNREHVYLGCNDNTAKALNLSSHAEFIGKSYADFKGFDKYQQIDAQVMDSGIPQSLEETLYLADGTERIFLSNKVPLADKNHNIVGMLGVSLDITERKQAEKIQLEKIATNRFIMLENIIALMPGHVYWMNREHVYLGCNDNQAKIFKLSSRYEIVGKSYQDLLNKRTAEACKKVDDSVMLNGLPLVLEEPFYDENGTEKIYLSSKVPLYDTSGNVIGMVGISLDITDRKQAESLQIEKIAAEKNATAMNILAGSIAHELRTPLAIINVYADLLQKSELNDALKVAEKAVYLAKYLGVIKQAIKETNHVIDMLLVKIRSIATSTVIRDSFQSHSAAATIADALTHYPLREQQKHLLTWHRTEADFHYAGDYILTKHILFNLIKNALYAIKEADKGTIEFRLNLTNHQFNQIIVKDTAGGIATEQLANIFNKFATSDQTHSGAGLGLAFCKLVMESYAGDISCESKQGEYTQFILHFPKIT